MEDNYETGSRTYYGLCDDHEHDCNEDDNDNGDGYDDSDDDGVVMGW